jgi:F-type H+-transporting ATPase subunit alpha
MRYLAPFSGCTMGEYFSDNGMYAVIIYDDLPASSPTARCALACCAVRPGARFGPGRRVLSHSRLLERAAKMNDANGPRSPRCQIGPGQRRVGLHILTNVISITDGQIFPGDRPVLPGICPAVNVGLGVARRPLAQNWRQLKSLADHGRIGAVSRDGGLRPVRLRSRRHHPTPCSHAAPSHRAAQAAQFSPSRWRSRSL